MCGFFFFKQKTAYEMRISDWSSDVCSSDLKGHGQAQDAHVAFEAAAERIDKQLRRYMRRLKDKSSPSQPSATLDEIQANASYIAFDAGNEEEEIGQAACRERGWQVV